MIQGGTKALKKRQACSKIPPLASRFCRNAAAASNSFTRASSKASRSVRPSFIRGLRFLRICRAPQPQTNTLSRYAHHALPAKKGGRLPLVQVQTKCANFRSHIGQRHLIPAREHCDLVSVRTAPQEWERAEWRKIHLIQTDNRQHP